MDKLGQIVTVLGAQWGDEGKGKLTDILAAEYKYIVRATGGANAGHTIKVGDRKFVFHLLPSGILHEHTICVIGNGCVVHIPTLLKEVEKLNAAGISVEGRLFISEQAHVVFDYHMQIDEQQESDKGENKVGTTKRGIGPCYTDKIARMGIRVMDLMHPEILREKLANNVEKHKKSFNLEVNVDDEVKLYSEELLNSISGYIVDTVGLLADAYAKGEKILVEGANGCFIDVDHGTYPFVTSSNPTVGGIVTGTGIGLKYIDSVIGTVKAYTTRVGAGPFVTELDNALGEQIRQQGYEFGSTTGRPRRCGWLDLVMMRKSVWLNSLTEINFSKLDVLSGLDELKVCTAYKRGDQIFEFMPNDLNVLAECEPVYETFVGFGDISSVKDYDDLPNAAKAYVEFVERQLGVPITTVGVGQDRSALLWR